MPLASDIAREIRARSSTYRPHRLGRHLLQQVSGKLASDHRKPNGQTVIPPEEGAAFVEELPVAKFHGIGPKTAER